MRRQQQSWITAFGTGLSWAMFGASLAYGYHLVFAPPSSSTTSDPVFESTTLDFAGAFRPSPGALATSVRAATDAAPFPAVSHVTRQRAEIEAKAVLAHGIQRELIRVGCFRGAVDGRWSEETQRAMQRFVAHVQVTLPTSAPDYILLTMLQGASDQSCGAPARKDQAEAAAKGPSSKAEPVLAMPVAVAAPTQAWSARVTTSSHGTPAPAAGAWRTVATTTTTVGEFRKTQTTSLVTPGLPLAAPRPWHAVRPLPGRMAVGAPAPNDPGEALATDGLQTRHGPIRLPTTDSSAPTHDQATRPDGSPGTAHSQRARTKSQERAARRIERRRSPGRYRLQNAFTALNRSAP